jgi:rhamnosyltransferase
MILAIVVSYNPNIVEFKKNIEIINEEFNDLIIFDNNSINIIEIEEICKEKNYILIKNEFNYGLPYAYNYVIKNNFSKYNYFATFDQDTYIPSNYLHNLLPLFDSQPKVGVVGPSITYSKKYKNLNYYKSDMLLQSGSIISKSLFNNVGFFYEPLFIDAVEFDFFLRARAKGFTLVRSNKVFIEHTIGDLKSTFGINYISHSPIRNYYYARNHVYLTKVFFFKFPKFIIKKNIFFIIHIFKLFILDRDINKIKNLFSGLTTKLK